MKVTAFFVNDAENKNTQVTTMYPLVDLKHAFIIVYLC